ncbi:DUF4270 domain-containing protein [Flavobacterium sp. J49]|uniref:DUF4270 domain-containing protein n=1 Tax=Flavobacterium sp. J49 TaxID=2718534 RepID=UPI0015938C0A|nr:DUF4270 domain-containing protein [Flavobacterium sp. J49]MBF6641637.1 DUF4270 domain-containing protein [Flavobacterium sp. J49]NIC02884.1 DUF4270 domain-containing protein [Flavobacterium sp. J49]
MFKKSYVQKILFGLMALSLFAACDKDFNELGTDIVGDDHFGFERYTGATVKAYNQKLGPIASNNLPINPLGFYANPAFGTTQANFVTQVELDTENPTFNNIDPDDYDIEPTKIDSIILDIPYFSTLKNTNEAGLKTYELDSIYGPENSKFSLSIYQSNYFLRDLDPNQSFAETQLFYTDKDAEINAHKLPILLNDAPLSGDNADGHENTQFYFDKREHRTVALNDDNEEVETRTAPSMRLHLNKTVFTNLLLNAPSGQLVNNSVFKNYFRGLYFKVENGNPGQMAMINFLGGKITVYYNEDKETTTNNVSTYERVFKTLKMSLTGNTVSLLNNSNENTDYLTTTANNTDEASKLYLKGGQGSIAVIDIFGPDADNNGIADEVEVIKANGWLINEANLTFYVDRTAMSDPKTIEPNRIFLYDLNNNNILVDYTYDFSTNSTYPKFNKYVHGGILEAEDVDNGRGIKYKIRLTNHVRNLISKDSTNVRLGLSVTESINNVGFSKLRTANSTTDSAPRMSVLNPLGTVLYGTNPAVPNDKRIKLEIYYTKPD